MAECKKLIIRNESGADVKVLWYPGSTDESIESCIKAALGLQPHDEVDVCDAKDGTHLAINENLPDGLVVAVNRYTKQPTNLAPPVLRESATEDWLDTNTTKGEGVPLLTDPDNAADNGGPVKGGGFQKQMLKFDRINAHLANERTWLAWIRTTFSLLSCGLTLQNYANDSSSGTWHWWLFAVGCATIVSMDFTYMTGWIRYGKVKEILQQNKEVLGPKMGRLKLKYQTFLVFATLCTVAVVYWMGGYDDFSRR
mmetsp:Transcript_63996/g.176786  ORF Transcript_63996/g.176786 Transcript_63996/m.176786 type:complete len:254 (+) Transcript_63996:272-1033(+)